MDQMLNGYIILITRNSNGTVVLIGASPEQCKDMVGDEIIEINGKLIGGHNENKILEFLNECVESKFLKLRVKSNKTGGINLEAGVQEVISAYLIAVEQEARIKLEKLTAIHCVQAVDLIQQAERGAEKRTNPTHHSEKGKKLLNSAKDKQPVVSNVISTAPTKENNNTALLKDKREEEGEKKEKECFESLCEDVVTVCNVNTESSDLCPHGVNSLTIGSAHNISTTSSDNFNTATVLFSNNNNSIDDSNKYIGDNTGEQVQGDIDSENINESCCVHESLEDKSTRKQFEKDTGEKESLRIDSLDPHLSLEEIKDRSSDGKLEDNCCCEDTDRNLYNEENVSFQTSAEIYCKDSIDEGKGIESNSNQSKFSLLSDNSGYITNKSTSLSNSDKINRKQVPGNQDSKKMSLEMQVLNNYPQAGTPMVAGYQNTNIGGYHHSPVQYSSQENVVVYDDSGDNDLPPPAPHSLPPSQGGSAHREMAIDVPSNFKGQKKEPPRWPPANRGQTGGHSVQSSGSSQQSTPSRAPAQPTVQQQQVPPKVSREEENQQQERIRKYQEDLRLKKEMEENFQREQDFLRNSLRDSQKLQALEQKRVRAELTGVVNPNYMIEEEDSMAQDSISKASTLPVRDRYADQYAKQPLGLEEVISLLQNVQGELKTLEDKKDLESVARFFNDPRVLQALYIHNKVVDVTLNCQPLRPLHTNSQGLVSDLLAHVPQNSGSIFADELRRLLQKTHFKHLMISHDGVAGLRQKPPKTTTEDDEREYLYERASQYGEESIKIVRLQKSADPLGATVRNEAESVIIGRIVKGGAAEKSGLLHEALFAPSPAPFGWLQVDMGKTSPATRQIVNGSQLAYDLPGDEILEINGTDVRGKSIDEVCDLMAALTGTLTFLIVPSQDFTVPTQTQDKLSHYKAHFDYDPEEDPYIPCRELGISFRKGDILHIINQTDSNWWQAYREGEDDQNLAGLIPSRAFQEQKEAIMQSVSGDKSGKKKNKCRCRCGPKHGHKNKKKQLYNAAGEAIDADTDEILTYEEVAQHYPQPNRKRPVVLIGPPNVGRQELRQRLMESDLDRFAAAVPHTSRHRKDTEMDGADYHFVPRHVFESDIVSHKFVEYGEYEKNLYGTSLEAIRSVVNSGKICVLNLHPQSLRILKASDLKPYCVFIAPPNIEKLKQLRQKEGVRVSDDELKSIIEKAREMEENYGHYFDFIIINYELDRAYDELLKEINRLEVEPQWVPGQWVAT